MSEHTKEPWRIVEHNWEETGIYPAIGSRVAVCEIDGAVTEETQEHYEAIHVANAKRIVACVNACEGGTTSDLMRIASVGGWTEVCRQWSEELAEMKQQRDELKTAWANAAADLEIAKMKNAKLVGAMIAAVNTLGDDAFVDQDHEAIFILNRSIAKAGEL